MAAFTTFSTAALERYLVMFDIGDLHAFEAIEEGIENSNYFVTLIDGENTYDFVLTITENLSFEEVPFFNELLAQLARRGLPVPEPERTLDGMSSTIFCGKPAWLFPKLPGAHPVEVTAAQCATIGKALAQLHAAAEAARYTRENPYDLAWLESTFEAQRSSLEKSDQAMLDRFLDEYRTVADSSDLPRGIIHGDLFRDNALFDGETLTGIIDFYHACEDFLVQDLAITINEWCTDTGGRQDEARYTALVGGYESVRPLTENERTLLPAFRRSGAMRFVLTRLLSGDEDGHLKDPEEYLSVARTLDNR